MNGVSASAAAQAAVIHTALVQNNSTDGSADGALNHNHDKHTSSGDFGFGPVGLSDGNTLVGAQEAGQTTDQNNRGNSAFQLSEEEKEQVADLKKRDAEVRRHERAHAQAGGQHAGAPSFSYQRGPDGRSYAVGGEVPIDVSPVPGDPQATIRKMEQVARAALAPTDPSSQDRAIAARAASQKLQAQAEAARQRAEDFAQNAFGVKGGIGDGSPESKTPGLSPTVGLIA